MVYEQTRIFPGEWDSKIVKDIKVQTDQLKTAGRPKLVIRKTLPIL